MERCTRIFPSDIALKEVGNKLFIVRDCMVNW